jgi:hypothetical protein
MSLQQAVSKGQPAVLKKYITFATVLVAFRSIRTNAEKGIG